MKSDKSFREFLSTGIVARFGIILLIGLLLIIIGSIMGKGEKSSSKEDNLEQRVSEMCSLTEGVGECRVMITYEPDGEEVYAVAVLCEGAELTSVRARLVELIGSLFGIGANRITVLKIT